MKRFSICAISPCLLGFGLAACEEKTDLTYFENAKQCTRYAGAEAARASSRCWKVDACCMSFLRAACSVATSC